MSACVLSAGSAAGEHRLDRRRVWRGQSHEHQGDACVRQCHPRRQACSMAARARARARRTEGSELSSETACVRHGSVAVDCALCSINDAAFTSDPIFGFEACTAPPLRSPMRARPTGPSPCWIAARERSQLDFVQAHGCRCHQSSQASRRACATLGTHGRTRRRTTRR